MSNKTKVLQVLADFKAHSTYEIMERLFPNGKAGLFRLGAYVAFLKDDGCEILGWFDKEDRKKYWYHLKKLPVKFIRYACKPLGPDLFMSQEAALQHEYAKK
jgi:hypothetical protein